jgi:hypothetical protein
MKKLVSFVLSLALVGMVGLTAGCKKKEEAPKTEAPKVEAPAPAENETGNVTGAPAPEKPAEKPAEKK